VSRLRPSVKRALFIGVAVALGLLSVEGGLRLAGYRPLPTHPITGNQELLHQYTKFRSSRRLIWELTPGWSGREGYGTVTINSRGLREREIPLGKPAGTFRILCLGDSVTFGHWVEAEEAYPRRLEERLQARSTKRIQVINAGVPGYSPFQELTWLEEEGWAYEPDLVLLGFVLNDVVERYVTLAEYGGSNTILGVDTTVRLGPVTRLVRRTAFHRFVTSLMLTGARRREIYSVRQLFDEDLSPEIQGAWEQTRDELDALAAATGDRGVSLVVLVFPFRFQIAQHMAPVPQRRVEAWGREAGVPVLDLTGVFARLGPQNGFLDHDHPTPAGHQAVAGAVAGSLEELGLVPAIDTIHDDRRTGSSRVPDGRPARTKGGP
jgi:lysophospholipase L1-like esterase